MIEQAIAATGILAVITLTEVRSDAMAAAMRFPGSPTVRVNGADVEPSYQDDGQYGFACRTYRTEAGLSGVPKRGWIERALRAEGHGNAECL
jgi:hypothetical protein